MAAKKQIPISQIFAKIGVALLYALVILTICELFMPDLQVYDSVFYGYHFEKTGFRDQHGKQIVYHGSLKKLINSKPTLLSGYLKFTTWDNPGTNCYISLECSDYIIEHVSSTQKLFTGVLDDYYVQYTVINKRTDEELKMTVQDLSDWLMSTYSFRVT